MTSRSLGSSSMHELDSSAKSTKRLFYRSPYKRVVGIPSLFGLPENTTYKCLHFSKSSYGTPHVKTSRKTAGFTDSCIWNYQKNASKYMSNCYHSLSTAGLNTTDSSLKEFHQTDSLMLPRIATNEHINRTMNHPDCCGTVACDKVAELPSILQEKLAIDPADDGSSDEESDFILKNSFSSLKHIDTVIPKRKKSSNEMLPPVSFRPHRSSITGTANNPGSMSRCKNQSSHGHDKRKSKDTTPHTGKTNVPYRMKGVHFSEEKKKPIVNAVPKLPHVFGQRLTMSDVKERELPPIMTKYFLGHKNQSVNSARTKHVHAQASQRNIPCNFV